MNGSSGSAIVEPDNLIFSVSDFFYLNDYGDLKLTTNYAVFSLISLYLKWARNSGKNFYTTRIL
jgi:hypothetical protein